MLDNDNEDLGKKIYNTAELINREFNPASLFEHPFNYYLLKNFGNLKSNNFIEKPSSYEIGLILDGFLSKMGIFNNFIMKYLIKIFFG